jgi:hypothetical protein
MFIGLSTPRIRRCYKAAPDRDAGPNASGTPQPGGPHKPVSAPAFFDCENGPTMCFEAREFDMPFIARNLWKPRDFIAKDVILDKFRCCFD